MASAVDLADLGVGRAVDIGDDRDDRDAVVEGLADAGHGVGQAGTGTTQKTPTAPVTRAEASAMTLAEDSCVTSRYGTPRALKASQNSLFCAPGCRRRTDALAAERGGGRLCSGHLALDAFAPV